MDKYTLARQREKDYHDEFYRQHDLFSPGSWLYKPVKYVVDSFTSIKNKESARALDLGCGVGRHSIPLAQCIGEGGQVVCVDLLESAIGILKQNAVLYSVEDKIISIVSDVDAYLIEKDYFDYVLSVSCIEHAANRNKFIDLIKRLQDGTKVDGINCFCIITDNEWVDANTGKSTDPLIELNLGSVDAKSILRDLYKDWDIQDISEKPWRTKETVDGKELLFKSNCLQFFAIKK